jgi:hypothetical protein
MSPDMVSHVQHRIALDHAMSLRDKFSRTRRIQE